MAKDIKDVFEYSITITSFAESHRIFKGSGTVETCGQQTHRCRVHVSWKHCTSMQYLLDVVSIFNFLGTVQNGKIQNYWPYCGPYRKYSAVVLHNATLSERLHHRLNTIMQQPPRQLLCLMRHGVRLDEKNPDADWGDKAERPYDTPLATDADSHAVRAAVVGPTRSFGMIPLSFSYSWTSSYLYLICGFLLLLFNTLFICSYSPRDVIG